MKGTMLLKPGVSGSLISHKTLIVICCQSTHCQQCNDQSQKRAAWDAGCRGGATAGYHVEEGCNEALCGAISAAQQIVVHMRLQVHAV